MKYTFEPKEPNAKAYGNNIDISTKDSQKLCRVINRKRLETAKKILSDLIHEKKSLNGKYYTKAAKRLLLLLESAEKNAEFSGLEAEKLRVHAAACHGLIQYRSRRKSDFGRRMKLTNVEIILIEDAGIVVGQKIEKQKAKKKEKIKEKTKKKAEEKAEEKTGEDKKEQAEKEKPVEKEEKTEQVKPEPAEQKKEVEQKKEEHAKKEEKKEEQNKEPREEGEKGDSA